MGTGLIGEVQLANAERVFVTWLVRPLGEAISRYIAKLRSAQIIDANGNPIEKIGMLTFGIEPNPDAEYGTYIGKSLDVTRRG